MKIAESMEYDDGKVIVKQTHDFTPAVERARLMRDAGKAVRGESRFVGTVPLAMVREWAKEAGVQWDDTDAMSDLIRRKMLSGEFSALRVWEGSY